VTETSGTLRRLSPAPVERRQLYVLVADELAGQIRRTLQPGDPIPPERELAELYEVGRSSVREALRMLESRGVIERRGGGAFVVAAHRNPFSQPLLLVIESDDVDGAQLLDTRRMLEAEAAALAAERHSPAQLAALNGSIAEMKRTLDSLEEFVAADIRFHLTLAEASGNRVILNLMQAIRERLEEMFDTVYRFPGGPAHSVAQHRQIAAAVARRDAPRARRLMTNHILRVQRELTGLKGQAAGR
jgi:GntR family transcriptional repressor for pyruvate dehydrogenase complex